MDRLSIEEGSAYRRAASDFLVPRPGQLELGSRQSVRRGERRRRLRRHTTASAASQSFAALSAIASSTG